MHITGTNASKLKFKQASIMDRRKCRQRQSFACQNQILRITPPFIHPLLRERDAVQAMLNQMHKTSRDLRSSGPAAGVIGPFGPKVEKMSKNGFRGLSTTGVRKSKTESKRVKIDNFYLSTDPPNSNLVVCVWTSENLVNSVFCHCSQAINRQHEPKTRVLRAANVATPLCQQNRTVPHGRKHPALGFFKASILANQLATCALTEITKMLRMPTDLLPLQSATTLPVRKKHEKAGAADFKNTPRRRLGQGSG